MNDYRTEKTEIPEWMCQQEEYTPSKDKEAFLTKSTKSVLSVLGKLRFHEGKDGRFSATPSLKLFYTLIYIILTASARNYLFVLIMCAAVTVRLAFFPAAAIRQVLSETAGAVMISVFLLLPAVFMGNPQTLANITARVYVSVTLVGILSAGTSWNKLTASMRTFRIPSLFIFTLDITLKYISVLGEICVDILTSVGLRSVGKNPDKAKSFSGAGTVGGGGLGDIAIRYGYYRYQTDIMIITIVILVVLVQILQGLGMMLSRKLDKRKA